MRRMYIFGPLAILLVVTGSAACHRGSTASTAGAAATPADPCEVALAPSAGDSTLDRDIAALQDTARREPGSRRRVLRDLGQRLIAKARLSNDPGFYTLAESTTRCLETIEPGSTDALLMRGHILHQLHRFKEAEAIARQLVAKQGSVLDYGLLGDTLMEQGRIAEATDAYQKMIDLKPYYQSYIRAAHMRWLKGHLEGAMTLMDMAAKSASPRDPEAAPWAYSRLAFYELQSGQSDKAVMYADAALKRRPGYAPALLARGRALLAKGQTEQALEPLRAGAEATSLPEYQWIYADALRALGRTADAVATEKALGERGAAADPRTYALYLASRGEQLETAVTLANDELKKRADVFTFDAVAWSLAASGRAAEAEPLMKKALAEGTSDARLFYHAGVIAASTGRPADAREWLLRARKIEQMLLPSERRQLTQQLAALRGL